jgi:putative tricarboxylic transport membrane protein
MRGTLRGIKDVFKNYADLLRGSSVGTIIGLIPGIGGTLANFLAYAVAVRASGKPETFGTGNPKGLVSAEAANNAKDGGALFPTLAFGIPGSMEMAVLLGAFILHGMDPGPFFVSEHPDVVWSIILGFFFANLVASTIGLTTARWLVRLTTIKLGYIAPVILVTSLVGTYLTRGIFWDVIVAVLVGILGYVLESWGVPLITVVMGYLLGPLAEKFFHMSMGMAYGNWTIFFTRPISLSLFLFVVLILLLPLRHRLGRRKSMNEGKGGTGGAE